MSTREALRHLVSAYGHAIDRRDWSLLRTLYHEDAIDDHTPYYCGPIDGFVAWLPGMMGQWGATMHTALEGLFVLEGDFAQGEHQRARMASHARRYATVRGVGPLCRSL
jgi:hypothetical protein